MLLSAAVSVVFVPLSSEDLGMAGFSWVLLTVGLVVALPLTKRLSDRAGVTVYGIYSILVLSHSAVFSWPLDLREAQLVVVLLGFAFMFYLKSAEGTIALVLSAVFFGSSVMVRGFDISAQAISMPLMLTLVLGGTAGAVAVTLRKERSNRQRYQRFIESAPLPMWEVDLSLVQKLVQDIKAQGAQRFCEHLEMNDELLSEAGRRLRVLSVNPLGKLLLPEGLEDDRPTLLPDSEINRALLASVLKGFWADDGIEQLDVSFGEGVSAEHFRFTAHGDGIAEGQVDRVTVIASNVSKDKNHGADLEKQIVDRERFVASISHEIRTPLSSVVGLAQAILETPSMSTEERNELLDIMVREGQDLTGIVEDLLVGARLDMGTLRIVLQDVDVHTEVRAVLAALGMKADVSIPLGSVVTGNRIRFRQIVRNMLTNAGRYGGADLRVRYLSDRANGFVEIRDNGAPIPVDQRELMFQAYERLHDRPGVTDSVGLGLPVSRSLARAMGGELSYDHDGDESIFRVGLPVAKTAKITMEVDASVSATNPTAIVPGVQQVHARTRAPIKAAGRLEIKMAEPRQNPAPTTKQETVKHAV
jgi:signal transduction histidine kinase